MAANRGVLPFLLVSLALHGAAVVGLSRAEGRALTMNRPVELVMVDVPPAPPPAPEPEPPKPEPVKVKPPLKVASTTKPPPEPPPEAPPPPNDAPPPETETKPIPLVVGISMSSTSTSGTFAAPVGNTVYGKAEKVATAPENVKPYKAARYAPSYQVDEEPVTLVEFKVPYPEQARRDGVEGSVVLSLTIDSDGSVVKATVLSGPGHGLDEAARAGALKFRWRPARKDGEVVATEIKYTYTFVLD